MQMRVNRFYFVLTSKIKGKTDVVTSWGGQAKILANLREPKVPKRTFANPLLICEHGGDCELSKSRANAGGLS